MYFYHYVISTREQITCSALAPEAAAFNTSPSSNTKGLVNNSIVVLEATAFALYITISAGPKLWSAILTSKVAEASVYAETADAYFEWKYVKAVSSGQPDSEEQINLANETLSNTVLATPNQELKVSFNDWQKSIITHLKEKREGEFLTKLGNLLNAALAPE